MNKFSSKMEKAKRNSKEILNNALDKTKDIAYETKDKLKNEYSDIVHDGKKELKRQIKIGEDETKELIDKTQVKFDNMAKYNKKAVESLSSSVIDKIDKSNNLY